MPVCHSPYCLLGGYQGHSSLGDCLTCLVADVSYFQLCLVLLSVLLPALLFLHYGKYMSYLMERFGNGEK